jgi:hypothetical protein
MPEPLTIDEERSICAESYARRYALSAPALEAWMHRHDLRAYEMEATIRERGGDAVMLALMNDEPLYEEVR